LIRSLFFGGRIGNWMMVVKVTMDFPAMAAAQGDANTPIGVGFYDENECSHVPDRLDRLSVAPL
jgi:hypothetical protein